MDKHTEYWLTDSLESLDTANVLFDNKKYLESAFFCHLAMEKMLKAFYTYRTNNIPPKVHNLLLLAERSGLQKEFSEEQMDFLAELNPFQLEGRYPGARQILYKQQPK